MHYPLRHRKPHHSAGQATVELALVLPIMCLLLFGVIQLGDAFWKYQQLSSAVSEGARKAMVSRLDSNPTTTVTNAVEAAAPGLDENDLSVTVSSTWTPGSNVTVSGSYDKTVRIMGLEIFDGSLRSSRTMRVEQ
jgi:Flp pilus assembly protein TadG